MNITMTMNMNPNLNININTNMAMTMNINLNLNINIDITFNMNMTMAMNMNLNQNQHLNIHRYTREFKYTYTFDYDFSTSLRHQRWHASGGDPRNLQGTASTKHWPIGSADVPWKRFCKSAPLFAPDVLGTLHSLLSLLGTLHLGNRHWAVSSSFPSRYFCVLHCFTVPFRSLPGVLHVHYVSRDLALQRFLGHGRWTFCGDPSLGLERTAVLPAVCDSGFTVMLVGFCM